MLTPIENPHICKDRVGNVLFDNIRPPIEGVQIEVISSQEKDKGYLIIKIPESPNAPHMVVTENENKYYRRDNTGKKPMSEAEIRELYNRRIAQEKRLEEFYAPLFEKLKQAGLNVEGTSTRWFLLFLPRPFQHNRVNIYSKSLLKRLEQLAQDSPFFEHTSPQTTILEEFIHLFPSGTTDYLNTWIHESGGVLISSPNLSSKGPDISKWRIPIARFVGFVEERFKFIVSFARNFLGNIELKTSLTLKNVGDWRIPNFLNHYDERFWDWIKQSSYLYFPPENEPRGGKPDITVECYVYPWQLEENNLRQFLKKEIFLPTLRAFGYPILDE